MKIHAIYPLGRKRGGRDDPDGEFQDLSIHPSTHLDSYVYIDTCYMYSRWMDGYIYMLYIFLAASVVKETNGELQDLSIYLSTYLYSYVYVDTCYI